MPTADRTLRAILETVIAGSPAAGSEAMQALRAVAAGSPAAVHRVQAAVADALADPGATWTPEQRATLARAATLAADAPDSDPRSETLVVRLTPRERAVVDAQAAHDGVTVSDVVRRALGLT